jgi:predicted PurR-regulated permease PerM
MKAYCLLLSTSDESSMFTMTKRRVANTFLLSLTAIALYFCYVIAKPFIMPIFLAFVLAIAFHPVHAFINKSIRKQNFAALVSTLLVILVIVLPAILIGIAITRELTDLYQNLGERSAEEGGWTPYLLHTLEKPIGWLGRYVDLSTFDLRTALLNRIQEASAYLVSFAAGAVGNITSLVVNSVIAFFTLFFLFREGRHLRRRASAILPLDEVQIEKLFTGISSTISASIYGTLAVAFAQGFLTSLAFWGLGLPSPILWGIVTMIFSLIPMVGSGLVWLPASIFLLASGQIGKGIFMLAFGAGVISMVDNFLRPYVMSGQVKLPTLLLFFALLGGVQQFGIIGLFVGPIVLAVTMTLFSMLREEGRAWRSTWQDEESNKSDST